MLKHPIYSKWINKANGFLRIHVICSSQMYQFKTCKLRYGQLKLKLTKRKPLRHFIVTYGDCHGNYYSREVLFYMQMSVLFRSISHLSAFCSSGKGKKK